MSRGLIADIQVTGLNSTSYDGEWYPLNPAYRELSIEVSSIFRGNYGFQFSNDKSTITNRYLPPGGIAGIPRKFSCDLSLFSNAAYFRVSGRDIGKCITSTDPQPYAFDYRVFYSYEEVNASSNYIKELSLIGDPNTTTYETGWVNVQEVSKIRTTFYCTTDSPTLSILWSECADVSELVATDTEAITVNVQKTMTIVPKASFVYFKITPLSIPSYCSMNTTFFFESSINLTNIGGGAEVLVDNTENLRTLVSGDGSVVITQAAETIDLTTAGSGAPTLATVLNNGNLTGGTDIDLGTDSIISSGDINLEPGVGNAVNITGNLLVDGTTTSIDYTTLSVEDTALLLSAGYVTNIAREGYIVCNVLPTTTNSLVNGNITAGVAGVSNPTIVHSGTGIYSAGDIIQLSNSPFGSTNDGLYECLSDAANLLTLKGIGLTATTYNFFSDQLVTDLTGSVAQLTKVTIATLRTSPTSVGWQTGSDATNTGSIIWSNMYQTLAEVLGAGMLTGGNSISVSLGDGIISAAGIGTSVGDPIPLTAGAGGGTSGKGGNIELTAGDAIGTDSDGGDVILNLGTKTGSGLHGNFLINVGGVTYKWAETDGGANHVLRTDGSGNLSFAADVGGETLAQTLALGNATGGNNIEISTGDKITTETSGDDLSIIVSSDPAAGGDLILNAGNSDNVPGNAILQGGDSISDGGLAYVRGGYSAGPSAVSGAVIITSGSCDGTNTSSGDVTIGTAIPAGTGTAGDLKLNVGSVVYTMPPTDGTSGQVLQTNASGVLSWATPTTTSPVLPMGRAYMARPAGVPHTVTVVSSGTYYLIDFNNSYITDWDTNQTSAASNWFSNNSGADNYERLTYLGTTTQWIMFRMELGAYVSSNSQTLRVRFAKNGTLITNSNATWEPENGSINTVVLSCMIEMATNDYIDTWVQNDTSTADIQIMRYNLTAVGSVGA